VQETGGKVNRSAPFGRQKGVLASAVQHPSPNQDERPAGTTISLLVIHNISLPPGQFGGPWIDDLFLNRLDTQVHDYFRGISQLRVSSHLLIQRTGELVQYVPFEKRAWHAGESSFNGEPNCNDYSIGIELEGTDDLPYTEPQYTSLLHATREIMRLYPAITPERITGHSQIAPGRKTDPGPSFDWSDYRRRLSRIG
jgi:AmpD protein